MGLQVTVRRALSVLGEHFGRHARDHLGDKQKVCHAQILDVPSVVVTTHMCASVSSIRWLRLTDAASRSWKPLSILRAGICSSIAWRTALAIGMPSISATASRTSDWSSASLTVMSFPIPSTAPPCHRGVNGGLRVLEDIAHCSRRLTLPIPKLNALRGGGGQARKCVQPVRLAETPAETLVGSTWGQGVLRVKLASYTPGQSSPTRGAAEWIQTIDWLFAKWREGFHWRQYDAFRERRALTIFHWPPGGSSFYAGAWGQNRGQQLLPHHVRYVRRQAVSPTTAAGRVAARLCSRSLPEPRWSRHALLQLPPAPCPEGPGQWWWRQIYPFPNGPPH